MLGRVLRLPGKALGALALAVLAALAAGAARELAWRDLHAPYAPLDLLSGLGIAAGFVLAGRVLLAWLPPGDVGGHGPHELALTLAASMVLGRIAADWLALLVPGALWAIAIVAVLALLRAATLPGAMVPRHRVRAEPSGRLELPIGALCLAWAALLVFTEWSAQALCWLALAVLLFHALGVARRRRAGRWAVLWLVALAWPLLGSPAVLATALSLASGAAFLVGWLRRADRRAGALAGIGFGSACLRGPDPLALAGLLVLVAASRPRQRRFALAWGASAAALSLALAEWRGRIAPPRGRALLASELLHQLETWQLAWPALAGALVLGALAFDWRAREWRPGTIEEPRREALALGALLAASCAALALPLSPWSEEEALVILFPLAALLAGLLLVPPEPAPAEA